MLLSGVGAKALAETGELAAAAASVRPLPVTVTSASDAGAGAAATAWQAAGNAERRITSRARGLAGPVAGFHGSSVNHQAKEASQPSLLGTASCFLQPVDPAGQAIRT